MIFQDIWNKAKNLGSSTYDYIANKEKNVENTFNEVKSFGSKTYDTISSDVEKVKSTIDFLHTKTKDFGDWMQGIDSEYKSLESYAKEKTQPFQDQKLKLYDAWKKKEIDDNTFNQKMSELTGQVNKFVQSDDKLKQFDVRKKEVDTNNAINAMPMSGIEGKIAGKTLGLVEKIAKGVTEEQIIPFLKKFKISDDVIKDLAPKLIEETNHEVIYRMTQAGKTISDIEKRIGYLGKDLRSNLSAAVDRLVKVSPDKETEVKALEDLASKTIKSLTEKSSITVEKQSKNLLNILSNNLDDIHKFSVNGGEIGDYGKVQDIITKLGEHKPVAPDDTRFAYELLKKLEVQRNTVKEKLVKGAMEAEKKSSQIVSKQIEKSRIIEDLKQQLPDLLKEAGIKTDIPKVEPLAKEAMKVAKGATGELPTSQVKKVVRETTGQLKKSAEVITSERKLLREKFRIMQSASKEGGRGAIKAAKEFRTQVRQYASDLPVVARNKVLSTIKFSEISKSSHINPVLKRIDRVRLAVSNRVEQKKTFKEVAALLKQVRDKGLIGKIKGSVRELGLKNRQMIKTASKETLEKLKVSLKEVLDTTPKKTDVSGVDWKKVELPGSSKGKGVMKKVKEGLESEIGVTSSNIRKYGGDELFSAIRERRFEINKLGKIATDAVTPFQKGLMKLKKKWFGGKEAYANLSHALFNQDFARAEEIAKKYKFEGALEKVRGVLDDIHKRAVDAGLKVGKLQNYFPRIVKDYEGLFNAYNKKFGNEGRSYFDKVLTSVANSKFKKVAELTTEERADALTNALRGYGQGKINIGSVGKARQFKELPVEFMKFYHTPEDALTMYVSKMNDRITLKKLFGLTDNEQNSIGGLVDGMNISPNDMPRLKESLGAILSPQGQENWALNKIRKSATLTLLSSVQSTLFQIADIGVNAYKHGSLRAMASLVRSKPFKRDELFTEIAHEFADSNVIKNTLKAVGFDRLDRLNNEAFMANAFREARRYVKSGSGSKFNKITDYANVVFRGDKERIAQFLGDIRAGKITNDVKLYVFNKVLDVAPRAIEEMPEAYAKNPNARIFYSMKSYGLKILDIYRNDVIKEKKTLTKAKNAIRLTAILTLSGAAGSQIRDWYNGKDTKFSDNVINNMLQIMMFSTYDAANVQRDGLGKTILSKALPPSRWMDDVSRDILTAGDGKGLYSLRDIPVIGAELYNRIGRGKESIEKANAKTSNTKLPKLKSPPKLKGLKSLKSL